MSDMPGLVALSRWLVEQPDDAVAVDCGVAVSAQEFAARVQAWVATLDKQPGTRWAVYHFDCCEFLAILQALWPAGLLLFPGLLHPATAGSAAPAAVSAG